MTSGIPELIVPALKDTVLFVLSAVGPVDKPVGTAFLVHINDKNSQRFSPFVVTNKHVLQNVDVDPDGTFNGCQYLDKVRLRFNAADGQGYSIAEMLVKGKVIEHQNPLVDLAVVPMRIVNGSSVSIEGSVVYGSRFGNCPSFIEGRDTVTVSLLQTYAGHKLNHPILRFGKIALISEENWCNTGRGFGPEQAWLVDLGTYEGASGSPVFLYPVQTDIHGNGQVTTQQGSIALVGVVKATLNSPSDPSMQLRALTPIEPVKNLQEIFDPILENMRQNGWDPVVTSSGADVILKY
ncbi:MAG: hypothetical protein QG574_3874 [Cyanobacteriota bacterium erpe_2018_sw_21hr_WHONDRS-SW48-000092_B_bin.40]|jgi:hypothetical protein|nr:hypothetical protein [Cyanobacteriota bacterium erpe_2018_sw_21hr_WHONDRS-SW48-000092_B_bin.40]MDQ5951681.1 hypothetical protein [Patescibacteria group bacterium]